MAILDELANSILPARDNSGEILRGFSEMSQINQRAQQNQIRLQELRNQQIEQQGVLQLRGAIAQQNAPLIAARTQQAMAQTELVNQRVTLAPLESQVKVQAGQAMALKRTEGLALQREEGEQLTALRGLMNVGGEDGRPSLMVRLHSLDPKVREDAATEAYDAVGKFGPTRFKQVAQERDAILKIPEVARKYEMAQRQQEERERKNTAAEGARDIRLDQSERRLNETGRHNLATESTAQQNADARSAGKSTAPGDLTITVPNLGKMPIDAVRRTLARGAAEGATDTERHNAETLAKSIKSISSGNRDENTGNPIPRYTDKDIFQWADEGAKLSAPQQGAAPAGAPTKTVPASTPSAKPSAGDILKNFGITGSVNTGNPYLSQGDIPAVPLSSLPSITSLPSISQIPGLMAQQGDPEGMAGLQGLL